MGLFWNPTQIVVEIVGESRLEVTPPTWLRVTVRKLNALLLPV